MGNSRLRLGFFGDDFTGSTDALEALAARGVRAVLFTRVPTATDLARHPLVQAVGIAGMTRAMNPGAMEGALRPALEALKRLGAAIVHYKVCSTFDSSPEVGSIGRAIDVGRAIFGQQPVPIVASTPSLGRFCLFGHLFARCGEGGEVHRIDRHPSMSRHPVTPMQESDLRLHLARQTATPIGLIEITTVRAGVQPMRRRFHEQTGGGAGAVLIDGLETTDLRPIGEILAELAKGGTTFIVGSSAVEESLAEAWSHETDGAANPVSLPLHHGPLLVLSGSCSPVTAAQVDFALRDDFVLAPLNIDDPDRVEEAVKAACEALGKGQSVIGRCEQPIQGGDPAVGERIGALLGLAAARIVQASPVRRVVVAGGDTSGRVAAALGITELTYAAPLVRGAPWCRARRAPHPQALDVCFKGGQIGAQDFFIRALRGEG